MTHIPRFTCTSHLPAIISSLPFILLSYRHGIQIQQINADFAIHIILSDFRLKDNSLEHVKIADFGLSEFYRPGGTLSSTSGTLSFQAPEVLSGTNHAGIFLL